MLTKGRGARRGPEPASRAGLPAGKTHRVRHRVRHRVCPAEAGVRAANTAVRQGLFWERALDLTSDKLSTGTESTTPWTHGPESSVLFSKRCSLVSKFCPSPQRTSGVGEAPPEPGPGTTVPSGLQAAPAPRHPRVGCLLSTGTAQMGPFPRAGGPLTSVPHRWAGGGPRASEPLGPSKPGRTGSTCP